MLNGKQGLDFNVDLLIANSQLNTISQSLYNVNDALINWVAFPMAQTWWLRKLVDLDKDGILHPIQALFL